MRYLVVFLVLLDWWVPPKFIPSLMGRNKPSVVPTRRIPEAIDRGMLMDTLAPEYRNPLLGE